mgnify:CR=1 FL=1
MEFFTSDQHYGHARILAYCKRLFVDIDQMNETLIANHNTVVGKKDTVYHLGDFAFRNHGNYLKRLNGQHVLILGNHDRLSEVGTGWQAVEQVMRLKAAGTVIWLSHYAHLVWPQSHYGAWHLFGHTHGKMKGVGRSMDVGVDGNEFKPWSFEQIKEAIEQLPVVRRADRRTLSIDHG